MQINELARFRSDPLFPPRPGSNLYGRGFPGRCCQGRAECTLCFGHAAGERSMTGILRIGRGSRLESWLELRAPPTEYSAWARGDLRSGASVDGVGPRDWHSGDEGQTLGSAVTPLCQTAPPRSPLRMGEAKPSSWPRPHLRPTPFHFQPRRELKSANRTKVSAVSPSASTAWTAIRYRRPRSRRSSGSRSLIRSVCARVTSTASLAL